MAWSGARDHALRFAGRSFRSPLAGTCTRPATKGAMMADEKRKHEEEQTERSSPISRETAETLAKGAAVGAAGGAVVGAAAAAARQARSRGDGETDDD